MKKPWLAALLNFFIPGAGYLYVGVRKKLALLLLAALAFFIIWLVAIQPPLEDSLADAISLIGFVISIILVIDGYRQARFVNTVGGPMIK